MMTLCFRGLSNIFETAKLCFLSGVSSLSIRQVRDWIKKDSFMTVLDLKDQFLHVPINKDYHKYLRFSWLGKLLEWRVLPFGLRCSPRVVTKILRPVMAYLRSMFKILIIIYIGDMIIQSSTAHDSYQHAQIAALILMALGWGINWEKSCFYHPRK